MAPVNRSILMPFARKYVWWQTPDEATAAPARVIAQVMDIGDHADVETLAELIGDDALRDVVQHAQPGQFRRRSWTYWHYRLGLSLPGQVPPLPVRRFR